MSQGRRPGDWDCDICGFLNFGSRSVCKNCTAPRKSETLQNPSYNNDNSYSSSYFYKPGDWNCPGCNFPNFASRNYCKQCGKEKPYQQGQGASYNDSYSYKPGDWNCAKCNFANFASRNECRNCGAFPMIEKQQKFKYLVALDFKATCNDPKNPSPQEIIEWAAKIVDIENKCILDEEFHFYIKPRIHPKLSDFCTKKTRITQTMVDKGDNILNVSNEWNEFCYNNDLLPYDDNDGNNISNACIVTFGDWDLKKMWRWQSNQVKNIENDRYIKICCFWLRDLTELEDENNFCIKLISKYSMDHSLRNPALLHSWINAKVIFQNCYFEKAGNLTTMLRKLNIEHIDTHHSGIDDVVNLCEVILNLLNQGMYFEESYTNWKIKNGINNDIEIKQEITGVNTDYDEYQENGDDEQENVGDEPENVGDERENVGDEQENVGDEQENVGDEQENVGDEQENVGDEQENVGDEQENVGDEQENVDDGQECNQCHLINLGKIDESDGLFYCNGCWDNFNQ